MRTRFAPRIFCTLFVLLTSVAGSHAKDYVVALGKGSVVIPFSKSWDVSKIDRGIEAKTGDDEIYIWAEAYREDRVDTIMDEHGRYFAEQGVTIVGKIKSETRVVNGLQMKMLDVPARWKGDRTVVQYLLVDPGWPSGWKLMLTEWASPKGDRMYQKDMDAILNGLSFEGR
ncbi:MAG: hypothetical protein WCI94_16355 [Rhodospirillales bacterium]